MENHQAQKPLAGEERRKLEANDTDRKNDGGSTDETSQPPPLMALNHVTRLCRSLKESLEFYEKVLGFVVLERPHAFDFDGAWLFNYGVGIHLVQANDKNTLRRLPSDPNYLDPMDNHISFQCEDMEAMERRLKENGVKYKKRTVQDDENNTAIDQLFFNDPDGFMIEICNCENITLVPSDSVTQIKLPQDRHNPPVELHRDTHHRPAGEEASESDHTRCGATPVAN